MVVVVFGPSLTDKGKSHNSGLAPCNRDPKVGVLYMDPPGQQFLNPTCFHLGARLRGRTVTQHSKKGCEKGSEKVLGRVLGKGSQKGSEKGASSMGFTV